MNVKAAPSTTGEPGGRRSDTMTINLDRFSQGPPAEARIVCYCQGCGGEIYEGEEVYDINGDITHADWECLVQYIDPKVTTIEEALGTECPFRR